MAIKSDKIIAKRAGKCRACGRTFKTAEPVWFKRRYGFKCQDCGPHVSADLKPRSPVPTPKDTRVVLGGPQCGYSAIRTMPKDKEYHVEVGSLTEVVNMAWDSEFGVVDASRLVCNSQMSDYFDGTGSWGNHFTKAKFMQELVNPSPKYIELCDELKSEITALSPALTGRRATRRLRRGCEFGDQIDPDRFLMRVPEMWERMERREVPARQVCIAINGAVNASRREEHLKYRGAAVMALVDYLSSMGVSVRVELLMCSDSMTPMANLSVGQFVAKDYNWPLERNSLAFMLCEIAYARMCLFAKARALPGKLVSHLGSPTSVPMSIRGRYDVFADYDILDQYSASRWLEQAVKKLNDNNNQLQKGA
ncbi:MAG: hypothetical protein JEZ07_12215 [Phycisphaerae bacterium]|nr:hypothetical protein [Phycisphaerae bacterium]